MLADNAVTHESELRDFTKFVRNHPNLASGRFDIGNGIEFTLLLSTGLDDTN